MAPSPPQQPSASERGVLEHVEGRYLLYRPHAHREADRKWPLMLFLHGAGERGNDLNHVKRHGPPKRVARGRDLPFIIVAPQCRPGSYWEPASLVRLLDEAVARYAVDEDRLYVTGISMGGFGTWQLAAEIPERIAAAAPICGGGDPGTACRMKHVPIWSFHGEEDRIVPLSYSEEMVQAVRDCGGDVYLTVYPGVGHDSWTETYENEALYDWFLQHRLSDRNR